MSTALFKTKRVNLDETKFKHRHELPDGSVVVGYLEQDQDCPNPCTDCDGAALCFGCAKREGRAITDAIRTGDARCGWKVEAPDVNWEDPELLCEHCGNRIESAYAEDDARL